MQMQKLPKGFTFRPTDQTLVGHFLYKKIIGMLPLSHGLFVPECDMYGKEEPWQIWEKFRGKDDFEEDLHFFLCLKKEQSKGNGYRIGRSTGSSGGCWHGEDSGSMIEVDGYNRAYCSATKKRLSYRSKESNQNGLWIMHEYSLEMGQNKSHTINYVLCRLTKNAKSVAAAAKGNDIASSNHKRKPTAQSNLTHPALDSSTIGDHESNKRRKLQTDVEINAEINAGPEECLESNNVDHQVEARLRVEQGQPSSLEVINIDDDSDEFMNSDNIHRQIGAGLKFEQVQPKSQTVNNIDDDNDECLAPDIIYHQIEARLRVKQEEPKTNGVPEAAANGTDEKAVLCFSDDEFFDGAVRYICDKFDDFTRGSMSLEGFSYDSYPNSQIIEPGHREIQAGLRIYEEAPVVQIQQQIESTMNNNEGGSIGVAAASAMVNGMLEKPEEEGRVSSSLEMPRQIEEHDTVSFLDADGVTQIFGDDTIATWYHELFPSGVLLIT